MIDPASNTKPNPYADAPRLPGAGPLDPLAIFRAAGPDAASAAPLRAALPDHAELELEIGPGRGGFIFERLAAAPETRLLGLEIRRKWATIVDRKLRAQGFGERARVFAEDARDVVPRLPAACLSRVFVHFPDPWWKKRHEKRLVVSSTIVPELVRVLVPGGEIFLQTDVEERALAYEALLGSEPRLMPREGGPWLEENPFAARSPREHRAIADGLPIYRLLYRTRA